MHQFTNFLSNSLNSSLQLISTASHTIAKASKEVVAPILNSWTAAAAQKVKQFYNSNKEIVIASTVAATVFLIMRKKDNRVGVQHSCKKSAALKKVSVIRSYVSEQCMSEAESKAEPTMITRKKKIQDTREVRTEQISFSEQDDDDEASDKVFFQVYKTYLQTE